MALKPYLYKSVCQAVADLLTNGEHGGDEAVGDQPVGEDLVQQERQQVLLAVDRLRPQLTNQNQDTRVGCHTKQQS